MIDYTLIDIKTLNTKGVKGLLRAREKRAELEFKQMSKEQQDKLLAAMRLMAK